jgi:Mn2+/Fe2+ NRAMP family transporter
MDHRTAALAPLHQFQTSRVLSAGIFCPTLPSSAIVTAVGALGALVMPYNIYFSSAVVMSRCAAPSERSRPGHHAESLQP